jgi:hypothetical protein
MFFRIRKKSRTRRLLDWFSSLFDGIRRWLQK